MAKSKLTFVKWNLGQIWNECAYQDQRPLQKRDYVYASEIGAPFVDRFLKMRATAYTNPPNQRSLNKFLSGRIWEYVVKQILIAGGVYKHEEVTVNATPYDGLSIHGRLDYKAGGHVDYEQAIANITILHLPEFLHAIAQRIIGKLAGGLLEYKILELKAISTFAMNMIEIRRSAMPQHSLQAYHYQKNGKLPAEIAYICKDSSRMAQFGLDKKACEKLYKQDNEEMTYYFTKNKMPPVEPLAKFDTLTGSFSKNLGVEYSPYLTRLHGFKSPEDYREAVKFTLRWNRALSRYALAETGKLTPTGKKIEITANNKTVRAEIIAAKYNFDECLKYKIAAGIADEEIET